MTTEIPEEWEPKYYQVLSAPSPTPEQAKYQMDLYCNAMGYGDYRD